MYSLVIPLWESVRVNKPVVSGALSGTSSFPEQENKLDNAIKVTNKRPFTEVVPGALTRKYLTTLPPVHPVSLRPFWSRLFTALMSTDWVVGSS